MSPNPNRDRRILLVLIILLLVSISYLALQTASYFGGSWQLVSGHGNPTFGDQGREPFSLQVAERSAYQNEDFGVIRGGKLFFKPRKVEEVNVVSPPPPVKVELPKPQPPEQTEPKEIPSQEEKPKDPIPQPEPPKPTCPYIVSGILWGEPSSAILVNKATQKSQTVRVGSVVGDFTVIAIEQDSVLVQSEAAEFKLKLGGM